MPLPSAQRTVPHFAPALAARTSELLDRPGVLGPDELERLVRVIAKRTDLWRPLVVVDRERRRYELLYDDERIDIWVLSWMPGQATGFHDHGLSHVGVVCVQGELEEGSLTIGRDAESTGLTPGASRRGAAGYIHAIAHRRGEPAASIHAYSPPLIRVGQYRVDDDGRLRREPEHGRKGLFDDTIRSHQTRIARRAFSQSPWR
jgi:Cysteine dioxygenase type I